MVGTLIASPNLPVDGVHVRARFDKAEISEAELWEAFVSPDDDIKHFLVTRDVVRSNTTVAEFGTDYDAAQDAYQHAEQEARGTTLDVILLGADSLDTIRHTHSSYFGPHGSTTSCQRRTTRPRTPTLRRPGARQAAVCFWAYSEIGRRRRRRPGGAPPFTRQESRGAIGTGCRFGLAKATAQGPGSSTPPLRLQRRSGGDFGR